TVEPVFLALLDQNARFHYSLCELLDEKRVSIGLRDDLFHHFGREPAAAGQSGDHGFGSLGVEGAELQRPHVGHRNPTRFVLQPKREQRKDRQLAYTRDSEIEQLERGGIRPVHVLEKQEDRLPPSQIFEPFKQYRKRSATLFGRT